MGKYRYPGAKPFETTEQNIFFGRERDTKELYRLIALEKLVVLYGKSGLGKSSLVNAALIPLIEAEEKYAPIPIRFGAWTEDSETSPLEITRNRLVGDYNQSNHLDKIIRDEGSLWYYAKKQQINGGPSRLVLIFDQFEELFTYPDEQIERFKKNASELLTATLPQRFRKAIELQSAAEEERFDNDDLEDLFQPMEVRILFAIRSDRMNLLDKLSDYFPKILSNNYELGALKPEGVRDAILQPALMAGDFEVPPFDYTEAALKDINEFLTASGKEKVETFQLQILCRHLESKAGREKLSSIDVQHLGVLTDIFENYYQDLIDLIDDPNEKLAARRLIEEGLIFEQEKRRLTVYEGQIYSAYNISPELLKKLVDTHLLRAEPSLRGGYTYELSHDTLVAPVLKAKAERLAAEQAIAAEQEKIRQEQLLEEERRKRQRARRIAIITSILAAISLLASGFAFYTLNKVREARKQAQAAEKEAISLQQEAEQSRDLANLERIKADTLRAQAERQKQIALQALADADGSRLIAERKSSEAERQKRIVEKTAENLKLQKAKTEGALIEANSSNLVARSSAMLSADPNTALKMAAEAYNLKETPASQQALLQAYNSPLNVKTLRFKSNITALSKLSTDGKRVLGLENGQLELCDADGQNCKTLYGHKGAIKSVTFAFRGDRLYSGSTDRSVKIWTRKGRF